MIIAIVTFVVLVGGFSIFLAWMNVLVKRDQRKGIEVLARLKCRACGAAVEAEAAFAESMVRKRKAHDDAKENGVILRIDTRWSFACASCKAELIFDPARNLLVARA